MLAGSTSAPLSPVAARGTGAASPAIDQSHSEYFVPSIEVNSDPLLME